MLTAFEAKLLAYRKRDYFITVEQKILAAAESGDLMCAISVDEIPYGTPGKIYEIARFLYELGYQTAVDMEKQLTLYIYWNINPNSIVGAIGSSEEEY